MHKVNSPLQLLPRSRNATWPSSQKPLRDPFLAHHFPWRSPPSGVYHQQPISPGFQLHINGTLLYVLFWCPLLRVMAEIHPALCSAVLLLCSILLYKHNTMWPPSHPGNSLGCFHFGGTVNSAAMNILVRELWPIYVGISVWCTPGSGISGSHVYIHSILLESAKQLPQRMY